MKYSSFHVFATLILALSVLIASISQADEGFWLFNAPPLRQLQEKYHFTPDAAWLEHIQKSSVRFNGAGSGAFVSANGLVITNHHVAADSLQEFGDAQHNYIRDGFYAATPGEEKRCYNLELNVLESIEDVTNRVNAAVPPGVGPQEALVARRQAIAAIEQESTKATGLRSDLVTLFEGGSYQLYRYKQYTDVRLVFAPEQGIAFFGGDGITSSIRVMTWISVCSGFMKIINRFIPSIIYVSTPMDRPSMIWFSLAGIRAEPTACAQ